MGNAADIENRTAIVEKGSGRIGQVSFVDVGAEFIDELLPARYQYRFIDRAFFGDAHHGRRRGGDLLHIKTEVGFPGVNAGR